MQAHEIVELLSRYPPFIATNALKDTFETKLGGNAFTVAIADEALDVSIGGSVASAASFVEWLEEVVPVEVGFASDGDALILNVDAASLRVRPSPEGYESAVIYFHNPDDGSYDWVIL